MSGQKPTLPGIREVFPDIFGHNGQQRQQVQHHQSSTGTSTPQPPRPYHAPTHPQAQPSQPPRLHSHVLPPSPMPVHRQGQLTNPPRGNHTTTATPRRDEEGAGSGQQPGEDRKRYACHICDMRFVRPSSLNTHINSHTGEQPFVCSYPGCTKAFSVKSNMQRHLRTVHQQT